MVPLRNAAPDPLAVKAPHFPARAKRVIFLFMHGGPSQMDTFDYKPLLKRDHGKPLPFARPKVVSSETFNLLQSPWAFPPVRSERCMGQRPVSGNSQMRGRYLLHQIHARFQFTSWRSAPRTPYGLGYVHPAEHGFLDYLRFGHRELVHAGLSDHLPDAVARRRQ